MSGDGSGGTSGRDGYWAGRDIHFHEPAPTAPAPSMPPVRLWGNVPARNPAFTGREEQLTAIRETLLSGNRAAVQAIHGMGGIGKSQLAIEYAHRFGEYYDVVWWLDAGNPPLFIQQYADLALSLGCAEADTPTHAFRRAVISDLHQRPGWLLIFDNAEAADNVRDWLPNGPGHVLITSRSAGWDEVAVLVPVDVLTRAESVELLQSRVPGLPEPDADALADSLGDLPLAIAQAASYLAEARMPAAQYVSLLRDRATDLLSQGKPVTYRATLTAVTTLAYDQLRDTDEAAADLAAICAFLAPEPIPVDWFVTSADKLPAGLATRLIDPLARSQLLTTLTRTALARLDDDGITMHRLIQAILRTRPQPPDAVPTRPLAEALLLANSRPANQFTVPDRPGSGRLLRHMRALYQGGEGPPDSLWPFGETS